MFFWLYPKHWGLKGKDKERAYAIYSLNGEELDITLNKIDNIEGSIEYVKQASFIKLKYEKISQISYEKELVNIDYKFDKISKLEKDKKILEIDLHNDLISEEDYDFAIFELDNKKYNKEDFYYQKKLIELELKWNRISKKDYDYKFNSLQYEVNSLEWKTNKNELDFLYGKINNFQYEKEKCTLKGIPYFEVTKGKLNSSEDKDDDGTGNIEFEFEYNKIFVNGLKKAGWPGTTELELVDNYFKEMCRQIADEEELFEINDNLNYSPPIDYN